MQFHKHQTALSYIALNTLPMRSGGPVPRFSPRMVTLVHATPSLGEIPVTNGGRRPRNIVTWGKQKRWAGQHLEKFTKNLFKHS